MLLSSVTRTLTGLAERALGFSYWADQRQCYGTPTEQRSGEAGSWDSDLTFNCSSFKSQYEFRFPARALRVALCPEAWRSEEDVRFLRSTLRTMPSFRRYSPHMQLKLARVVRYERFARGRVVVRRGQRGSSFYFVFSGLIAVTQDLDGSSAFTDPEPILMRKGAGFGDVALLKGQRRNATVVCMQDTELLAVDREDFFNHQLDQELRREELDRKLYFRSLPLFSSWSDKALETLADHCKTEEVPHGQLVLRDSSTTSNLVFITKGQCSVLRLVELSQCPSYHRWIRQQEAVQWKVQGRGLAEKKRTSPANSPASVAQLQDLFPQVSILLDAQAVGPWEAGEQLPISGGTGASQDTPMKFREGASGSTGVAARSLPQEMDAGVYLRIDSLKPGQHVRAVDVQQIESFMERDGRMPLEGEHPHWATPPQSMDPRGMVVVSQGSQVIRVKLDKFSELADWETVARLQREAQPYPSDDELCQVFLEQNRWRVFKSEVLSTIRRGGGLNSPGARRRRERGKSRERSGEWDINRRGLLHLTQPTPASDKVWAATDETAPPRDEALRLIHAIAIPKSYETRRTY
ncbi:cyclic nucleotide-binding domain-containing protein 2 [Amia ocellicauda]|uniref:cyclic nucleotide-binding domain-containing protein 2 n=1 Tax=Amia ocellicauda TaxID=2972642 RepID=UPI003464ADD4